MSAKRHLKPAEGFKTLEEEIAYYGRRGSEGSVDESAHVEFEIAPEARSQMISIRVPADLLDSVRDVARSRGIPYQTLMKEWLREATRRQRATSVARAREGAAPYGGSALPRTTHGPMLAPTRDTDLEQFRLTFAFATSLIGPDYFQLPRAGADAAYRERVYCYELYHQLRNVWGGFPYSLGGEVDKSGQPFFEEGPYAQAKPDLVVHTPGTMVGNLCVVEVKPAGVRAEKGRDDLRKLTWFCRHARYHRGIFLVYGDWDGPQQVEEQVRGWRTRGIDFGVLDLFYHRRAGEPARRLRIEPGPTA